MLHTNIRSDLAEKVNKLLCQDQDNDDKNQKVNYFEEP